MSKNFFKKNAIFSPIVNISLRIAPLLSSSLATPLGVYDRGGENPRSGKCLLDVLPVVFLHDGLAPRDVFLDGVPGIEIVRGMEGVLDFRAIARRGKMVAGDVGSAGSVYFL